jgi:hypothetical protein
LLHVNIADDDDDAAPKVSKSVVAANERRWKVGTHASIHTRMFSTSFDVVQASRVELTADFRRKHRHATRAARCVCGVLVVHVWGVCAQRVDVGMHARRLKAARRENARIDTRKRKQRTDDDDDDDDAELV